MGDATDDHAGDRGVDASSDITGNDVVAFGVEVAAFVFLAMWGWRQGDTTIARWGLAFGLPSVAAIAWGLFAAPRSRVDVLALEVVTKVAVLGGAVLAARAILSPPWWLAFTAAVVVNTLLMYVGPWARPR